MSIKDVTIENKPYNDLDARLWKPEKPLSGIIITHSWRNDMDEPVCKDAAKLFYDSGYSVLQLNLPGHSKNDPLRNLSFKSATRAVSNAVNFLQQKTGTKKIFGFGVSLGGAAIAFNEENLFVAQALLSYSPLISPEGLYERYKESIEPQTKDIDQRGYAVLDSTSGRGVFEMGAEWIDEMKHHSSDYSRILMKSKTPAIMIQGTKDARYDKKYDTFVARIGKKGVFIDGADHNFTQAKHRLEVVNAVKEYFDGFL